MSQLEFFFTKSQCEAQELFRSLRPHIVDKFWEYHEENPHVYELFKRFAGELKVSGRKNYGAKAIIERIRWHLMVETHGEDFKMANNHTSCYARLLMAMEPSFEGFFELRHSPGTVPLSEGSISSPKGATL